jgi:AraC-like DNA-binding protein
MLATERGVGARSMTDDADHVYHAHGGFLYTTSHLSSIATVRPSAVVLISALHRPFELRVRGSLLLCTAAAIRPQVCRSLRAFEVGLVSVNVHPTHPHYRSFQTLGDPGVLPMARGHFGAFDTRLSAACAGRMAPAEAANLFEALVEATLTRLPHQLPVHPLRKAMLAALARHRNVSLADLARDFGVSYHRMSHLFTEVLGLSFRAYCSFDLMRRASRQFSGQGTLTDIALAAGFTDSAHLSHTWRRRYGLSPSYVRDDNCVQAAA